MTDARLDMGAMTVSELEELVSPHVRSRREDGKQLVEKEHYPGSKQLEEQRWGNDEIVDPPIDQRLWAAQLARSTRLLRGIRTIARNVVGLGWEIVPVTPFTQQTPQAERDSVLRDIERVTDFFKKTNLEKPFTSTMECEVMDEEATGNGYLEFTRTLGGELERIYHVPSITVRILRKGRGYAQLRDGRKVYFKKFGESRVMDARNGRFEDEPGFNENEPGPIKLEHRANELMHFPLYHPMSEIYGLPRFIPAAPAIAGNYHAARRNVSFFINDAVPRMAIMVSGGALTAESKTAVQNLFKEGQGADQAHRILVLQTVAEGAGVDEKNNVKLDLKPLTVGSTEDGSFLNYRRMNDEEIRECLGLSEVYFKSEKLTKASAVVAKATTDEQEFEPARNLKEEFLNQRVVQEALNAPRVKLRFKRPDTSDPVERAVVHKSYSETGVLSINETRQALGKEAFPAAEKWADLPLPLALVSVQGKLFSDSAHAVEPPAPPVPAGSVGSPIARAVEPPTELVQASPTSLPADVGPVAQDADVTKEVGARIQRLPERLKAI